MRAKAAVWSVMLMLVLGLAVSASAQPPRQVRYSGVVRDATGLPRTGVVTLTFSLYAEADSGTPVYVEAQSVTLDGEGRYTVLLGATRSEGLPVEIFASGAARWLGVRPDGDVEGARVALVSVPYALKAADADTVGGKPVSAFVLAGGTTAAPSLTSPTITPTLTSGSAGYLGVFTNATDLGNSTVFQLGTNIGVGTTTPAVAFHVVGTSAPAAIFDVYSDSLGALPVQYRAARGTPGAPTAVQTDDILGGLAVRAYNGTTFPGGKGQVMFRAAEPWTATANGTYLQFTTTAAGQTAFVERMRIDAAGRVGIGTASPGALLHVAGDALVDGNIAAKYQDVAEWVESGAALEPGTVVVVDPTRENGVRPSSRAYDAGVAGAVSAQPGVILGERGASKSLIAQSGRVRIKVDATYGAIQPGDLLVTSPTAGYAMVSQAVRVHGVPLHRPGTILGKALEPLATGKGEILVLITLQ